MQVVPRVPRSRWAAGKRARRVSRFWCRYLCHRLRWGRATHDATHRRLFRCARTIVQSSMAVCHPRCLLWIAQKRSHDQWERKREWEWEWEYTYRQTLTRSYVRKCLRFTMSSSVSAQTSFGKLESGKLTPTKFLYVGGCCCCYGTSCSDRTILDAHYNLSRLSIWSQQVRFRHDKPHFRPC